MTCRFKVQTSFPFYLTLRSHRLRRAGLLHYTDELIIKYNPTKVFIYEGDNDIAYDKTPKEILNNFKTIIKKIKLNNKETYIVLISAKPSPKRWYLKKKYK
ncbi:hypothetical protein Q4Q34_09260 [Flavivirga abyssicola]|uniref:hypothetical protein n=1 Tax=Flavivirga abyssicola TaxID=3063533 RepID=UPI0026DF07E5|nr:hypothetical protein [Flavivirga sp. MEBiC07777]WVK15215.1 hypothetical protein Q4Q34_09260 [Flavivirga sp. MEBiC07777]